MGPWGMAAIALIGATTTDGGRKLLRAAAKNAIRAGLMVKEKSSAVLGELKEQFDDVIAEVKAEATADNAGDNHDHKNNKKNQRSLDKAIAHED
jgi:hypothetical protein